MTSAISLSGHVSLIGSRTGERGGKGDEPKGQGFSDTLADVVGKRDSKLSLGRDQVAQDRDPWLIDAQEGPRISLPGAEASVTFGTWQIPKATSEKLDADASVEVDAEDAAEIADLLTIETVNEAKPASAPDGDGSETTAGGMTTVEPLTADGGEAEADVQDANSESTPKHVVASVEQPSSGTTVAEVVTLAAQPATAQAVAGKTEQAQRTARPQAGEPVASSTNSAPATTESDGDKSARVASPANEQLPKVATQARGEPAQPVTAARAALAPAPTTQPPAPVPQDQQAGQTGPGASDKITTAAFNKQDDAPPSNTLGVPQGGDNAPPRVSVMSATSAPALAPTSIQVLGPTSAGLVSELAADPAWRSATQAEATMPGSRQIGASGIKSLRIQLHPIELGMVTARLTQTGSQMSIEIQVESNDARQRLSNDSDQIVKALKAIGIEVDKVTIQQAPQSASNASALQQNGLRDTGSQQQQTSAESGSKGQGDRGAAGREGEGTRHGAGETTADRAGSGVYI